MQVGSTPVWPERVTGPAGLLDNIVWHALTGAQADVATGQGAARRFARGFSPILGFADPARPDFAVIAPDCAPGEAFYCMHWQGVPDPGWHIEAEGRLILMVCDRPLTPAEDGVVARLTSVHVPQAMALAERTRPGPFGPRTIELGDYVGVFEGGQLVAMAGERMRAGCFREISGVCTDEGHRGRGHARRLISHLLMRQHARGETSFLHVTRDNAGARGLYAALGYREHFETQVRVVARR